jgi:hypothetical protein
MPSGVSKCHLTKLNQLVFSQRRLTKKMEVKIEGANKIVLNDEKILGI